MLQRLLYVLFQLDYSYQITLELIRVSTAFRYPHVNRLMLVLWLHPRDRHSRLYQPGSKLSDAIAVRPAHGSGEQAFKFPALVYLHGAINLTPLPDLLRCPRQERHPRHDVPPNDSAIPHGPLHPRSCQPTILGLLPRRRSPLLQILPPYLPEIRLYSSPHNLGLRRFSRCTGLVVIDRTGRCSGIVLACCGGE